MRADACSCTQYLQPVMYLIKAFMKESWYLTTPSFEELNTPRSVLFRVFIGLFIRSCETTLLFCRFELACKDSFVTKP